MSPLNNSKKPSLKTSSDGFTIVELMIATVIFSMVLMICSFAIIHVGRMYYKGMIMNRTQDVSRKVVDDISSSIQFSSIVNLRRSSAPVTVGASPNNFNVQSLCIGNTRYSYTLDRSLGYGPGKSPHVLYKDRSLSGGCEVLNLSQASPEPVSGSAAYSDGSQVEMLGENMRVAAFNVDQSGGTWTVSVTVSYGDPDDFERRQDDNTLPDYNLCRSADAGGQFCAVSSYTTTVRNRL